MEFMTKRKYYEDYYQRTFEATVLSCEKTEKGFEVILDETYFYPEGGGQPADKGYLGEAKVLHVKEKEEAIIHLLDKPLEIGSSVHGIIDWNYRFELMQNHSGEHIISGIVHAQHHLDNVGFHMGEVFITIDFNGKLTEDDLIKVEALSNQAVYENIEIYCSYPEKPQLAALNYRSKKELQGPIRIVEIPGYDICACCGIHVKRTGEIGTIKFISSQSYKGGTRINLLCGKRAVDYYNQILKEGNAVSKLLSAKPLEITNAVERLLKERDMIKFEAARLRNTIFTYKAKEYGKGNILVFENEMEAGDVRRYCSILLESRGGMAAVFSGDDEKGYKYVIGSDNKDIDVRPLTKEMNTLFSGRGGGPSDMVQGSLAGVKNEIRAFFANKGFK